MRLLVFGSRTFEGKEFLYKKLDLFSNGVSIDVVIEGEAPGADTLAKLWAIDRGIEFEPYPADWDKYGRAAGPIRNTQMLKEGKPDMAIGFIDKALDESRGSKNMFNQAEKAGVTVVLYHWSPT